MTDPHRHDHHDHDHDHDHAPDDPAPPRAFELLEQAIRELLIEKGLLTAEQIQRQIDDMDSRPPMNGIRLVAKAWTDPARSEEHTSELQSLMRNSYAVFCLKKQNH